MNVAWSYQMNLAWRAMAALFMLGILAGAGGCSTGASLDRVRSTGPIPSPSDRSFDPVAADFRRLLRTYITAAGASRTS
jgi:hypothetical protein